ncbi:MAG: hypothetical protein K9J21_07245 [Bacteroidales bacterium]|nr:hypothetical protein [Bacteroidales bacterium]
MHPLKRILVEFSAWLDERTINVPSEDYEIYKEEAEKFLEYRNSIIKKAENEVCKNCNYKHKDVMSCLLRKCKYLK